jgi:3-oxoacyl-[acyl-carrier protein] reductase
VVVTGASRGLGAALVRHFLDGGACVVGCARGDAPLEDPGYRHVRADVGQERDVQALFATVRETLGGLDVLVNNAGVARMNPMALMPAASAAEILHTNVMGTFLCTRAGLRLLRGSTAGRIVNLTTVAVPLRLEGEAMYAAAKSAVETFTRIVAREIGPMGITCNAVGPSPVRTALTGGVPAEKMDALVGRQAVARWATPEDVINVVEFFARPESGMVTGQVVYLGGAG